MQVNISGHHVELTDALKQYAIDKVEKLEKHFDNITSANVTLVVEKQSHKAEASIHVAGADLFANAEADSMYAAIDSLSHKLDRQVIRHKEKFQGKHHRESVKQNFVE